MFISKKPNIAQTFYVAVVAAPLALMAMAAKSVNDYYYPKDVLVCKDNSREAHIYGSNSIGWANSKTLALIHKDATGKSVYDMVVSLRLNDLKETAEAKMAAALKVAQKYCQTGKPTTP